MPPRPQLGTGSSDPLQGTSSPQSPSTPAWGQADEAEHEGWDLDESLPSPAHTPRPADPPRPPATVSAATDSSQAADSPELHSAAGLQPAEPAGTADAGPARQQSSAEAAATDAGDAGAIDGWGSEPDLPEPLSPALHVQQTGKQQQQPGSPIQTVQPDSAAAQPSWTTDSQNPGPCGLHACWDVLCRQACSKAPVQLLTWLDRAEAQQVVLLSQHEAASLVQHASRAGACPDKRDALSRCSNRRVPRGKRKQLTGSCVADAGLAVAVALLLGSCLGAESRVLATRQLQRLGAFAEQPYSSSLLCLILQRDLLPAAFSSPAWGHVREALTRRRPVMHPPGLAGQSSAQVRHLLISACCVLGAEGCMCILVLAVLCTWHSATGWLVPLSSA